MTSVLHRGEASSVEKIEDEILDALKSGLSSQIKVEAFPADPRTYNFASPAACLIHYSGGRFDGFKGPANPSQPRRLEFSLVLLCRALRGQGGAYRHLEDIRLAVQGRVFGGSGPVQIIRQALSEEKDGIWRFETSVTMAAIAVARLYQKPAPLMRPAISE